MDRRYRPFIALALLALFCLPPALAAAPEEGASGRAAPDLAVVPGSFGTDPNPARLWDTIRINVTVVNQGDADAGQFSVAFYLNNTTKSIGTATVNSLPAGNTANVSANWATANTETFMYYEGVDYKILVRVDSTSRVSESNETNNDFYQTQALGPPRLPDLSLVDFSVTPAAPVKGDLCIINVSFTNVGEAAGKFFRVYAYLDELSQAIGYVDVATVNPSEVRSVSLKWDTSGVPVGAHSILVHVNPEFLFTSIDENNYSNNNGSKAVTVTAPDFQLELASIDIVPAEPHVGDTLNVTWTVRNAGARPAENFTVRLTLDGEEMLPSETATLAPGAEITLSAETDTSLLSVGNHALRVLAGNLDTSRTVVLGPMRLADLRLRNVSWDPQSPRVDQSVVFTMEAHNAGGLAAGACTLALFVDYSPAPVLVRGVPALEPDACSSVRFLWDTTGLPAGTHYLRIQVDSGTVVAELNESNNNHRLEVVLVGELDLGLENLTIRPRPARVGDGVQFQLLVRNLGSLSAPATNLSLAINGLPVDRRSIGALARGRSADVTLAWATTALQPGSYTYDLSLDDLPGDVAPDNNRLAEVLALLEPPPAPDLRVSRIDPSPPAPRIGDRLTLSILVENAGNRDSGASSVMVYLDSGTALLKFTDSPLPVPAIPAGGSVRVNASRDTSPYRATTYTLNVTVDYKNDIAELNETNNRFTMELALAEREVQLPVLSVGEASFEGKLRQGSTVMISAVVSNTGAGAAYAVNVSFIVDGAVAGTVQFDVLQPGANRTATLQWKAVSGSHGVSVKAETSGANTAAGPLKQVSVAKADTEKPAPGMTAPLLAAAAAAAGLLLLRRRKGTPV
jgi:subtilase family serine protease